MIEVMAVNKTINGFQHEAVVLTCESPVAVYSVELLTIGTVMRIDGIEAVGFPNKHSTNALLRAYCNVNDMAERYLQTNDAVKKANLIQNMQRAISSAL